MVKFLILSRLLVESALKLLQFPEKVVPLSDMIAAGQPLLEVNLISAARNASAVRSNTSSMCVALVVQHVNKQA